MTSKTVMAKYWPAALFAVSNIAALTLVIKANSAVDAPATTSSDATYAAADAWGTTPADAPFDPLNSSATVDGKSPLLWDFGSDFDLDRKPADSRSMGFLDAAKNRLRDLKNKATDAARRDQRKSRERELLSRPWNLNYYDPAGNFLGRHSISPPWSGDVPPLPPLDNYQMRTGGHDVSITTDGNRTMILRVDPQWFKDNAAMSAFVQEFATRMIVAGIQPQVEVGRQADSNPLGVDAGQPGAKAPVAVMLPPDAKPARVAIKPITINQSLPKPPSDIRAAEAPPVFNPNLGDRLPPPPDDIRNAPEPGPLPAMPSGNPTATRSNGATVVRRSEAPMGPPPDAAGSETPPAKPEAKPAAVVEPARPEAKPETKPETKPEPKVRVRIQLSQIADKRRAEEAVSRLRSAGYGGSMQQGSGGLGYWLVFSRAFTSRKEATAALAKIRSMGYDAWLNSSPATPGKRSRHASD